MDNAIRESTELAFMGYEQNGKRMRDFFGRCQFYFGSVFNLERYFSSCTGGPNSLHHSFLHFPLDIWKLWGNSHMKRQGMLVGNLNLTPKGDNVDVA